MPTPPPDRAVSERWLDELAVLRPGGPTRRYGARARVRSEQVARRWGDRFFLVEAAGGVTQMPVMWPIDLVFGRWTKPPRVATHAEVALYPPNARAGDLPLVVVDFAVPVAAAVGRQRDGVDVRGEPAPGHAIVLVLDDGEVAPCQYPAMPPPAAFGRRPWGWRG